MLLFSSRDHEGLNTSTRQQGTSVQHKLKTSCPPNPGLPFRFGWCPYYVTSRPLLDNSVRKHVAHRRRTKSSTSYLSTPSPSSASDRPTLPRLLYHFALASHHQLRSALPCPYFFGHRHGRYVRLPLLHPQTQLLPLSSLAGEGSRSLGIERKSPSRLLTLHYP